MDDLFGRLAADLGVDRAATEMAVGILLRFQKERPAVTEAVGLSADRIDAVIRESAGAARENSRDEAVGGIARAVPCHSFDV